MDKAEWEALVREAATGNPDATQCLLDTACNLIRVNLEAAGGTPVSEHLRWDVRFLTAIMPQDQATALGLHCAGRTTKEIAATLQITSRAVASRLRQAQQRLLEQLLAGGLPAPGEARLSPELRAWALQHFNEAEVAASLKELREKGGLELRDFLHELEQIVAQQ